MELMIVVKYLIKLLGVVPVVTVLFMWSQGYVDEFYQARNNAPWIDDFFRNHATLVKAYWLITALAIIYGYYAYLRGIDKSLGFASIFATLAIFVAFVLYFILIKDIPKAGP
ncbi:hypothetical protein [Tritonibacter mobilis]|uniref:hypothetical protein n=1 Tax=Tritonibacter mobilis TaxID=379347 RepID=UPI0013A55A65|nr:hypothetical protein [Tritonibacter mobilis]